MSELPLITNALVLPGISVEESSWSLQVGLVTSQNQIAWSECRFENDPEQPAVLSYAHRPDNAGLPNLTGPDFGPNEGAQLLQETIIPLLIGRSLNNLGPLMAEIDDLRREVTIIRPKTAETPPQKRSRRQLFTSLVNLDQEIRETVQLPLPPELRFGLSLALVEAAARVQGRTVVETLTEEFGLARAGKPLAVHLRFADLPNPNDPVLARITAASYGLEIGGGEALAEFGSGGIRLQNRVRQLTNRVKRYVPDGREPHETAFLFDLKGGLGRLYDFNSGQILGNIFGLEQTTKPFRLRLVDPLLAANRADQLRLMAELQGFLRLRQMRTTLLARVGVETAEDIQALADHKCCDGVVLDMRRLGTVRRTIELAAAARERGLEVVLAGVAGDTSVQIALALNPTLTAVSTKDVSAVGNEMNRVVSWLGVKG